MKRTWICAALTFGLATLPLISEARGDDRGDWGRHGGYSHDGGRGHGGGYDRGHGGYYRGNGGYYRGYGGGYDLWPFLLGAATIGAVATIASGPYYGGTTVYYDDPPPPPPAVYYGAPSYGYVVPQTCTYYPDGSSYCR